MTSAEKASVKSSPEAVSSSDKEKEIVGLWANRRTKAESLQTPLYQKFKQYYDQFYAVVRNTSSPWRSKLYLPEFFTIILTKASVITSKPLSFEVTGRTNEDYEPASVAEQVMNYQIDEPHVKPGHYARFTTTVMDSLVTGTGIAEVPFKIQKDTFRRYPLGKDGLIDTSKVQITERIARWNEFLPIDFTRFFKDPYSTSVQTSEWIIVEDFQTPDCLKAYAKQYPGYYNLSGIDEMKGATDSLGTYTVSRNNLLNISDKVGADQTTKYLQVWRCYGRKYDPETGEPYIEYLEIVAGQKIIRSPRRLEFWHNQYPFAVMYDYDRPHEFWGVGEIEVNESVVKGINDNVNQFFDNKNLSNNTMIMRRASTILEPFIIEPGGEVIYDGEAPTQFRFPDSDGNTFQLAHMTLEQALERSSGVSGYSAGVPSAGVDKTRGTKGGIQQITENANTRFAYTQRQVANFLEQIGRIWLSNIQQFFTEDFFVRLTNGQYKQYKPEDIQGEFDVHVTDNSLTPANKQQKLDMLQNIFESLDKLTPALAQEGLMVKISDPLKRYLELLGESRPEDLITEAPAPSQPDPKRNVAVTFVGNQLPPDLQAELLAEQFAAGTPPPTGATMNPNDSNSQPGQIPAPTGGLPPDLATAGLQGMASPLPGNGETPPTPNPTYGGQ